MSRIPLVIGLTALAWFVIAPARAQEYEPTFILDFQNVQIADVTRSVEKIVRRPITWEVPPQATITNIADRELPARDVLLLTRFMLSLLDFDLVERSGGALEIEPTAHPADHCSRPRADTGRLAAELARRGDGGRFGFRFESVWTVDVLRLMSKALQSNIVVTPDTRGRMTLASDGAVPVDQAFRLLAGALEREGYVVVEAPAGAIGVVPCGDAARADGSLPPDPRPRVVASLFGGARELQLALLDEDLTREQRGRPPVAAVGFDGVVLELADGCRRFAVGEFGAGKLVTCPAKREEPPSPASELRDNRRRRGPEPNP